MEILRALGLVGGRGQGADRFRVLIEAFRLAAGETVLITGRSGSGKTTVLELLGLILAPLEAERFELTGEPPCDLGALWRSGKGEALAGVRAARLGFVLQTGGLLPFLDVEANILTPRRLVGLASRGAMFDEVTDRLGIGPLLKAPAHTLSIGERQRTAIARAMLHEPSLILADEPTAALDPDLAEATLDLLVDLARRANIGVAVVTHDLALARRFGCREYQAAPIASGEGRGAVLREVAL